MKQTLSTPAIALVIALAIGLPSTACAAGAGPLASADDPYAMRTVMTGSMIAQDVMRSPVPFDKRYEELTARQKQSLFADYDAMPAGNEPPFPQYGLGHMLAKVRQYAATFNQPGEVVVKVDVDVNGDPVTATVYKSPSPGLAQLIGSEVALEKFKPAVCGGQPCAMTYTLRLDMIAHTKDPLSNSTFQNGTTNGSDDRY
jgi:hypothetical protein